MFYEIAHFFQKNLKPVWALVESANAWAFKVRYGKVKGREVPDILSRYPDVEAISLQDVGGLASFFARQPEDAFKFFKPHGFDEESLTRLVKSQSYLMYSVKRDDRIIGYFFLRCFFVGKCYLGKMVDYRSQGQGVGKEMCLCAMDIAQTLGLKMFESISKDNLPSLYSSQSVLETRIVKEMENNYLLIEDVRRKA